MHNTIEITIDAQADAAYIQVNNTEVHSTVAVTEDVNIDLDEQGCATGIEVLTLDAEIPFSDLTTKYHVRSEVTEALRMIRPSVAGFLTNVQASREVAGRHDAPHPRSVTS